MIKILQKYKNLSYGIKASLWFLIATFFQRGVSVLSTPIYTRIMTTTEYGQYSVFTSWLDIFTVLVSLKLYSGVFSSGYVKFEKQKDRFSSSLQGLCLSLTLFLGCIYLIFQTQINKITSLNTIQSLAMFSIIWTTSVFSFWSVEQRTGNKYLGLVIITIIVSIAKSVIGITMVVLASDKVTARILSIAIVELLFYIWLFLNDIRRGKVFIDIDNWRYALRFSIPLIPHYLSTSILNSSDRIMIKKLVGEDTAGIYGLAYSISMIMTLFNSALYQTMEPWIFKKIKEKKTNEIRRTVYFSLTVIGGVNILLIAFAPEVVRIFAPMEFYEAIWVIPPVAMSIFFMFMYSIFATFEFYFEKKKYIAISTTVGAVINIILNYVCIKIWGYIAAGYTTFICYMIYAVLHYLVMNSVCKNEIHAKVFNSKIIIMITLVCTLIGVGLMSTYNYPVVRYVLMLFGFSMLFVKRKLMYEKAQLLFETRKQI